MKRYAIIESLTTASGAGSGEAIYESDSLTETRKEFKKITRKGYEKEIRKSTSPKIKIAWIYIEDRQDPDFYDLGKYEFKEFIIRK